MNLKDQKGVSALLLVLALAGMFMMLFVSMGNVFQSLNKSTNDLKKNTASANAMLEMAQIVSQAYYKAKVSSPPTPPSCNGEMTAQQVGTSSIYLCLPASYCTQEGRSYCIASPLRVYAFNSNSDEEIYVASSIVKPSPSESILDLLIPKAHAVPPSPWLPDVDAMTPPTLRIVIPTCTTTTGNDRECIRCQAPNKNADCIKIRICTNDSSTCPNEADYIEPVFAIQTSYN